MRTQATLSFGQWLTAFAIAVGIWAYVALHGEYTLTLSVPITYTLPSNFVFATRVPDTLAVNVRGSGFELINFLINPPSALHLSFAGLKRDTVLTFAPSQIARLLPLRRSVDILNIFPASLQLHIGKATTKKVPLDIPIAVTPEDQYILAADPKVFPDSVIIRGHPAVLDTVTVWRLPPVHFSGLSEPVSLTLPLSTAPPYYLSVTPATARIALDIQLLAEYSLWDLPVSTPGVPQRHYHIRPRLVQLTVRGGIHFIEKFLHTPLAVQITLPLQRVLSQHIGMLRPKVYLPPHIQPLSVSPRLLQTIRRVPPSPDLLLSPRPFYPAFLQPPQ